MSTAATLELPATDKPSPEVMLADGSAISLAGRDRQQLHQLQWDQEQKFAKAILACKKGTRERSLVTGQAYDTVCAILAAQQDDDRPLDMGVDVRYVRLVLELLSQQIRRGLGHPALFEIGYGSGTLLKEIHDHGYQISGIEVSPSMREQASATLGSRLANRLLVGNVLDVAKDTLSERPTMVYWNDVFEHICPDEIEDYLRHIHTLLVPGGVLVTITPNWLMRPSDVTGDFSPPGTEACGLHLKEYRLGEVAKLLRGAGFRSVATPLAVSRRRIYMFGGGLRLPKQWSEPLLDRLPFRYSDLLCRGLGMSMTIATK